MSIEIKGMEMPETCFECPFMFSRRYCRANLTLDFYGDDGEYTELKGRVAGCPLVLVPDDIPDKIPCKCYHAEKNFLGKIGVCWGTKECEACSCSGDQLKCDFYDYLRERAKKRITDKG